MEEHEHAIKRAQIVALIGAALDRLYANDSELIDRAPVSRERDGHHHAGERAIVFRLAHYMQNLMDDAPCLKGYVLDCEYNRNIDQVKTLPSFSRGVYPDVIIHRRGRHDGNLLIMEVKSYWNDDLTQDVRKIREFLDARGEYHYAFGLSLIIQRRREDVRLDVISSHDAGGS